MFYVYILRSKNFPSQTYIGSTSNLRKRLSDHNAGKSIHTNKFKPWEVVVYVAVPERLTSEKLENYLKSGSGRAFASRHHGAKDTEALKSLPDPPLLRKVGPPPWRKIGSDLIRSAAISAMHNSRMARATQALNGTGCEREIRRAGPEDSEMLGLFD